MLVNVNFSFLQNYEISNNSGADFQLKNLKQLSLYVVVACKRQTISAILQNMFYNIK